MTAHTDPPNTHADADGDEQLPCGRLLSEVWDAWEAPGHDPHMDTCPHCQEAVRDLDQLEVAVRGLRDEPAEITDSDASTLTRRVMDVVRLELRPGRPLPLGEPDEDLWIMEAVAARTLRAAAETVPGVRAGSCRIEPMWRSGAATGPVEVRLEIHAPSHAFLPDVAEDVRTRARDVADRELGLDIGAVEISITDLVDSAAHGQEGGTR
ncbi:Asp23/Gls24 family envelope stress response protein [Streptomyces sp. NPDC050264]|uniref:Asp23/Gls24 family envelope stress response protein n=1 Tax=Streptomyces sp. NPDC050264 TaxID=3155038 RepID=UPI003441DDF0